MPRVLLALLALAAASCGGSSTATLGAEPGEKALLTWSDVESRLVGTFNVPAAQEPGTEYRFGYSNAVHAQLANGNLLVAGHPWYSRQAEVALPATLDGAEATRVGDWLDVTDGVLPSGWEGGPDYVLGGLLPIGDRLHFTKHQGYNGAGTDWETQGVRQAGAVRGPWRVDGPLAHHSRVGGSMSPAPLVLRTEGWTYLAGLEGTSGAALGRWGPNLFAIRADETTPSGGALPSRALLCHDSEANAPTGWWIGDKVSAVLWIETPTHHGVLVLLRQKLGATWYGEADVGGDPYGGGKGYHAEGYASKAWIYDPADLLAVYRGERDPWTVVPAEEALLVERRPGSTAEVHHSVFTGRPVDELQASLRDGRLIVLEPDGYRPGAYEGMPKGYVFDLE